MARHRAICCAFTTTLAHRGVTVNVAPQVTRRLRFTDEDADEDVVVCLALTAGDRAAMDLDLARPGILEGLADMARHEGVGGYMILYGLAFRFEVVPEADRAGPRAPPAPERRSSRAHRRRDQYASPDGPGYYPAAPRGFYYPA